MKSATSLTDYSYIATNMRHAIMGAGALTAASAGACLLHSRLGGCCRARQQFGPAEHHCHVALYGSRQSWQLNQCVGCKPTLLANLALVWEDRQKYRALAKSLEDLYSADLSAGDLIYGYLYGCSMALEDGDFDLTFANVDETLWEQAPTSKDLKFFEVTVLFCYLWARWQTEATEPSWRRQRLEQLEKETVIVPIEALSSISTLILAFEPGSLEGSKDPAPITQTVGIAVRDLAGMGELQSRKSNPALRARRLCCGLTELAPTALHKLSSMIMCYRWGRRVTGLPQSHTDREFKRSCASLLTLISRWACLKRQPKILGCTRYRIELRGLFHSFLPYFQRLVRLGEALHPLNHLTGGRSRRLPKAILPLNCQRRTANDFPVVVPVLGTDGVC
jgi:hypothetical protein